MPRSVLALLLLAAPTLTACPGDSPGGGGPADDGPAEAARGAPSNPTEGSAASSNVPPGATTVGDRLGAYAFSTLLETAPVPLHAGGTIDVRAQTCGGCHADIHAEWQQTTHAAAMRDPQFIAELAKPDSPRWLCLTCHAPLQDQRPYRLQADTALVGADEWHLGDPVQTPHPGYIEGFEDEAVTCASCHVRLDDDGHGTVLGARGDTDSPHRVRHAPDELRNVCVRCHAPGDGELTPTFPCWFDTFDELQSGPHAGSTCSSCHMPSVERPLAVGAPARPSVHHFWVGGGVPKDFETYDTLLDRQWHPGFSTTVAPPRVDGDELVVALTLTNDRGGHAVPTADPERHLRVRVLLEDLDGATLATWTERIGQRWDWGDRVSLRPARQTDDNRLLPGEARALEARLPRHADAARVVVEILHVRLAPENLRYAMQAELDDALSEQLGQPASAIAELHRHYPTFSYVFRETHPLDGSSPTRDTAPELVSRSRSAQHWSLEELERVAGE